MTRRQTEEQHLRLLDGRTRFTLVFLVADENTERERIGARIASLMGGETVRIEADDEVSTASLLGWLAGEATAGPVQVIEPGAWPEGFRTFSHRLNYGRPKFGEQARRGLLMWMSTAEIKELSQQAGDFRGWRSAPRLHRKRDGRETAALMTP